VEINEAVEDFETKSTRSQIIVSAVCLLVGLFVVGSVVFEQKAALRGKNNTYLTQFISIVNTENVS